MRSESNVGCTRGVAVCLAVWVACGIGCEQQPADALQPGPEASNDTASTHDVCRGRLEGALRRLTPDSLNAMDRMAPSVGALNSWMVECVSDEVDALELSEANLEFLDAGARRIAAAPRYTNRDAVFIRDSIVASQLANAIVMRADQQGADSEQARLLAVFHWVGNNISLQQAGETEVRKGFLETLLTGRGTPEGRVWVFAVLMRQLQRDAVLLVPQDAASDMQQTLAGQLLAVCLEDSILLMDPQQWFPVVDETDTSILGDNPLGAEFLTRADGWKAGGIQVIAETSAFCVRQLVLQEQLPAESSAILYEELAGGGSEILPLVERIVQSAPRAFAELPVTLWKWPDEQVTAAAGAEEQQQRLYDDLMKPFEAPFERAPLELGTDFRELLSQQDLTQEMRDNLWAQRWQMEYRRMSEMQEKGESDKLFGRPSSRLLRTRLAQVSGSSERRIIQQLQKVRNACMDEVISFNVPLSVDPSGTKSIPIPEAIQGVNRRATGSSLYWIGICQVDRAQPGTAISSFASYRRQYPDGAWFYPSLINQALAELSQGRADAAEKSLTMANVPENAEQARAAILLQRVQAQSSPAPADTAAADSTPTAPEDDDPPEASTEQPADPPEEPATDSDTETDSGAE